MEFEVNRHKMTPRCQQMYSPLISVSRSSTTASRPYVRPDPWRTLIHRCRCSTVAITSRPSRTLFRMVGKGNVPSTLDVVSDGHILYLPLTRIRDRQMVSYLQSHPHRRVRFPPDSSYTGSSRWRTNSRARSGLYALSYTSCRPYQLVQTQGNDLAPIQKDVDVPENVHWICEDATRGLPFSDGYFDVIHARALLAGVRDWKALITEMIRLLRPGGLLSLVEWEVFRIEGMLEVEAEQVAPGFVKFSKYLAK